MFLYILFINIFLSILLYKQIKQFSRIHTNINNINYYEKLNV